MQTFKIQSGNLELSLLKHTQSLSMHKTIEIKLPKDLPLCTILFIPTQSDRPGAAVEDGNCIAGFAEGVAGSKSESWGLPFGSDI